MLVLLKFKSNNPFTNSLLCLVIAIFSLQMVTAQEQIFQLKDTIYDIKDVAVKPEHSKGIDAFYNFVAKNFKVPEEEGIKGKIIITFIIEIDGSTSDVKAIQDIGFGSGEKMVAVIKKSGKWIPAQKEGKIVRVLYQFPIIIQSGQ